MTGPTRGRGAAGHARLRSSILRWYRKNRRDLPWRRTRDPYAIWVSEIMLQQTRVETVIPYYERFLERFPDVASLADAPEADVLAAWSGLGYYSRARSLRQTADLVAREHAGRLPDDPAALRALPGIGPYTSAAIASIAYGRPAAAVDGNVIRVLARIAGLKGRRDAPALRSEVERVAESLARGPRTGNGAGSRADASAGDWTQAVMELGALVCLPREPRCDDCPAARDCVARASGDPSAYPAAARAGAAPAPERHVLLIARRGSRVLLVPGTTPPGRAAQGGTWTLPTSPVAARAADGGSAARKLARALIAAGAGAVRVQVIGPKARFRHRTYAQDLQFEVWEVKTAARGPAPGRWVDRVKLATLPLRAPTLKALKHLQEPDVRPKR
jgi:A/G-specific adenine glycosylase